jgi:hypothetical protein
MKEGQKKGVSRRQFLVASTVGMGCLGIGLKEALAQVRATGKPLLTQESLNNFINNAAKDPKLYERYVREASLNLKGFVKTHFTLTSEFEKNLNAMSSQDVQKFTKIINSSVKAKSTLQTGFFPEGQQITKAFSGSGSVCVKVGWGQVCISVTV